MKLSYKDGTRCRVADKEMYSEKRAKHLAGKWKPDERGSWGAYKCKYGKTHWHVGHNKKENQND